MKFLHEYEVSPNGIKHDMGWWEIDDDGYLYNRFGGRHKYEPKDDDEIIEVDDWSDIIRMTVRDDSQITGFISPDGEFFGCAYKNHYMMEEYFFGMKERELEEKGFIKIYKTPLDYKEESYDYLARTRKEFMTEQQKAVLESKGFVEVFRDLWGKKVCYD